jgi:ferritin-like metal-binding protein YciE
MGLQRVEHYEIAAYGWSAKLPRYLDKPGTLPCCKRLLQKRSKLTKDCPISQNRSTPKLMKRVLKNSRAHPSENE